MRCGHFAVALFAVSLGASTFAQTQKARPGASPDTSSSPLARSNGNRSRPAGPTGLPQQDIHWVSPRLQSSKAIGERGRAICPSDSIDSGNAGASPLA